MLGARMDAGAGLVAGGCDVVEADGLGMACALDPAVGDLPDARPRA